MKTGKNHQIKNCQHNATGSARNIAAKFMMLVALWSMSRCSPFVCDMQGASLAGKHKVEITPGISSVQFAEETKTNTESPKQTTGQLAGMQVAYGVSDKMDVRVRIEHVEYRNESVTLFSVGPKFMLKKDRIALFTPIWFMGFTPVSTQPTLLFSIPVVSNKIEFNPSVKTLISLGGYAPTTGILVAWKVGFGISTDLSRWAIRPEYGVAYNMSEKSQYSNYSIGLSLNLSTLFKK